MNNPVVLDACTIVNLARIDENDFLEDQVKSLLHSNAAELVMNEVRAHYVPSDKTSTRQLHVAPYWGGLTKWDDEDDDIKNHIDSLRSFLNYRKKPNGELYSAALSLSLSRAEHEQVLFYTDDNPAKLEFTPYFDFQQIGYIGDSVDLLILLYWLSPKGKFSIDELKKYLTALRGEYMMMLNGLQKDLIDYAAGLSSSKKERSRKFKIEGLANELKGGMSLSVIIKKCVEMFENDSSAKGKEIMRSLDHFKNTPEIVDKVNATIRNITQYGIYKI